MKLFVKLLLVIISLSIVLFNSCKENAIQPVDSRCMSDYEIQTIGSWCKYDVYYIDSTGNKRLLKQYTSVLEDIVPYEGKQAMMFAQYDTLPFPWLLTYYSIEECKLLQYIKFDFFGDIVAGWFVQADFDNDKWTMIEKEGNKDSLGVKYYYNYKITISKGDQKDFQIKGKTIQAQEFIGEITSKFSRKNSDDDFDISYKIISHSWVGKGIGYIYGMDYSTDTLNGIGSSTSANENVLVDYEIK